MTYPDPDPHPSGPWGPRELIRYARDNGFERIPQTFTGHIKVWRSPDWRVSVEAFAGPDLRLISATVVVDKRRPGLSRKWDEWRAEFLALSCGQLVAVLRALGVLPSVEEVPA